ncbi:MAG TPA: NUDIX domain-containing protein [Bacteroidales bacterium]|nr:NUDIX domain-containing protein [Bacteroidales bacterium]
MKDNSIEIFPIVDEDGNVIGEAPRSVCHDGKSFLLHPVVHLKLFNPAGEMFLQKRSLSKDIQPGKWDTSVGGHIDPGENVEDALARETREELGITDLEPSFDRKYIWKSDRERELVYSFSAVTDKIPLVNHEEIDEGKYWTVNKITENLGLGIFTPNFEYEFRLHNNLR